jgi:hypothetical protein
VIKHQSKQHLGIVNKLSILKRRMASRLTGKGQNDFILKVINYFAFEVNKLFFN